MAWTKYQLSVAIMMVITGTINTLTTKWADNMMSIGVDGALRSFNHPFVQACVMFLGEMLCLVAFKCIYYYCRSKQDHSEDVNEFVKGNRNFNPFVLFVPAMCDMIGTCIMYVGLNLTYASSFQMFRGSVIIFVGILSITFLDKSLGGRAWSGIFVVIIGLAIVGVADFIFSEPNGSYSRNSIITGDLLIILAQIITASQMVYEERYVTNENIPALQAIGWEGFFGLSVLGVLLFPMYFIQVGHPFAQFDGSLENAIDAFVQIGNNYQLLLANLCCIISIAFFNTTGITVTKELSATTRMVLDSMRTVIIWAVALGVGWQIFHWLQVVGFLGLIFGLCLYNNVLVTPLWSTVSKLWIGRRYTELTPNNVVDSRADGPTTA